MSSDKRVNRIVSVNKELLLKVRDAFKEVIENQNIYGLMNRLREVESLVEKGSVVSIDYSKIIEWRNTLGCYGRTDLEKDLNFRFQYFI